MLCHLWQLWNHEMRDHIGIISLCMCFAASVRSLGLWVSWANWLYD